ncbi:Gfo/Idh/MocA family protein [Paenibacillus ginsengarvi]|uniref:Gfo/Idh/MocA family oxidoreductase n=1 Tax=Paenibacillus ginsengarvi TaxID=400777 RepID=A0A3B0CIN7_9BACL|nr:Gfo/Idh/MocA family oxidoreductase [Paenibacillus ginsengarvi]RKN85233.1 gfo/Idh/MocA family oxidoreductase [Paenibacillus ginsengarvi]
MNIIRAGIIGIGGFGAQHVRIATELAKEGLLEIVAFADLRAESYAEEYGKLTALGAKHYTDYEQMLGEHPEIDFVAIATPIAAHKPMCVRVMQLGFHVIVEKPPAVTIQDLDEMIAASKETGKWCQVDFQNTSGRAFRELLTELSQGAIGQVTHVTGVGMWKRTRSYYDRTRWAGKLTCDGQYVLDGTFNNPLAHLLNNCMVVAGSGDAGRAIPETVQAELYHVNDIEGDDTSVIRIGTKEGVTVHFYAMLSHHGHEVPYISIRGTEGEAYWNYQNTFTIRGRNGEETKSYSPEVLVRNMYLNLMQAISGSCEPLYCPIEACRSFMLASNGAYESAGLVREIPMTYAVEREEDGTTVRLLPELSERMKDIAQQGLLYSEASLPWAVPTSPFRMEGYNRFELFADKLGK